MVLLSPFDGKIFSCPVLGRLLMGARKARTIIALNEQDPPKKSLQAI